MVKISIIIPLYNAEKYIERCLNSLIKQNDSSFEVIIVNDGSKDNTISIIRDFEKQYPNKIILVKDKKNGLGAKCNFAELMKYSKQEYPADYLYKAVFLPIYIILLFLCS